MGLFACMVISLLAMAYIPAWPVGEKPDYTPVVKMVIALVFVIIAWMAYAGLLKIAL